MNQLVFLIIFLWLPLIGLIFLMRRYLGWMIGLRIGLVTLLGLVYAAPFINVLSAARIWYFEPGITLGVKFGYVPMETYANVAVQIILTALVALWCWRRFYPGDFEQTE